MLAITNNGIDIAFVVLMILSIALYGVAEWYRDSKKVKFSSLRDMFNELDKDKYRR